MDFLRFPLMLLSCTALLFGLASCGGSSGGGNASDDAMVDAGDNDDNTGGGGQPDGNGTPPSTQSLFAVLPPGGAQPNTISPAVLEDSAGTHHAAYTDIDGRGFYASCRVNCTDQNQWQSVQLLQADITATGSVAAKIQLDSNQHPHIAFAVNDSGGVLSNQAIHYGQCETACSDANNNWQIGQTYENAIAMLGSDLQQYDWFALNNNDQPRFAFIEPEDFFSLDTSLYFIACDLNCVQSTNWSRQAVTSLDLAYDRPASLLFDNTGAAHVALSFNVVGADTSSLQYLYCIADCNGTAPTWSNPAELAVLPDDVFTPHVISIALHNDTTPVIGVYSENDNNRTVEVFRCQVLCNSSANWSREAIPTAAILPENIVSLSAAIDLQLNGNQIDIALIGRKREFSIDTAVIKLSCTVYCPNQNWSYWEIADSSPIQFANEGVCIYIGTAVRPPLSLSAASLGLVLYPHWACNGAAVEVFEPATGLSYIDYNSDVRFFEVAAYAQQQ